MRPTKRFAASLFLLLIISFVAYAVRVERLIDSWQPKHYVVSLTLNNQLSEIVAGSARIDVLVLKKTSLIDLDFGPGEESLDVALFYENEIPWQELAFRTVSTTLRHYFDDRRNGGFRLHAGDIPPPVPAA